MKKIERMDKAACSAIAKATTDALDVFLDNLGLKAKVGGGTFDPAGGTYKMKIEFAMTSVDGKSAEEAQFLAHCESAMISKKAYGEIIAGRNGNASKVCGILSRDRKGLSLLARDIVTGKTYRFNPSMLGQECPSCFIHGGCDCRASEKAMAASKRGKLTRTCVTKVMPTVHCVDDLCDCKG